MNLFPFIKQTVELKTTKKQLIQTLRLLTEEGFDLARRKEKSNNLFVSDANKQYEAEIFTSSFRARKLDDDGYQDESSVIKNTIYGRMTENEGIMTFKYIIAPNVYTSIILIALLLASAYLLYDTIFISKNTDFWPWLLIAVPYPLFLWNFNSHAIDDELFIDRLISRTLHE